MAVPVVLDRLKQVDAEWRKNKREWEKVWREVDSRNLYKSLGKCKLYYASGSEEAAWRVREVSGVRGTGASARGSGGTGEERGGRWKQVE